MSKLQVEIKLKGIDKLKDKLEELNQAVVDAKTALDKVTDLVIEVNELETEVEYTDEFKNI